MVYISGEEMTKYSMQLVLEKWVRPHVDTSKWEHYDLSCKSRDQTDDKVLKDSVTAGKRIGAIFKEPTVTPTEVQRAQMGLKKALVSPNGAMRRGWNGITISRDTIHIKGLEHLLGFKKPVLFERHAVGGEYQAGWKNVGKGTVETIFTGADGKKSILDSRVLNDSESAVVTYHNPLDNVVDLAHIFFQRCLDAKVTPYVVTKKTVFKWQEGFWARMKSTFDKHYKIKFLAAGLLDKCGGDLPHLISDAATMQIIRWTGGGFGMAAHNYDGDMLTDEIAQIHRSPGFITSNLIGKNDDGSLIKEFEASHGTVADMWNDHLAGKETSFNPLGMVEALMGAMNHAAVLKEKQLGPASSKPILQFTGKMRTSMEAAFVNGLGTRDLAGPQGLTTEKFVDVVAELIEGKAVESLKSKYQQVSVPVVQLPTKAAGDEYDSDLIRSLFQQLDVNGDGSVTLEEFEKGLKRLNVAPRKPGSSPVRELRISLDDPF